MLPSHESPKRLFGLPRRRPGVPSRPEVQLSIDLEGPARRFAAELPSKRDDALLEHLRG